MVTMSPDRTDGKWIPGYQESGEAGNPPTIDEILSLFRESQLYYGAFHQQCATEEDFYTGRRTVPHPEGIDPVWPSTATAIVNVGTDHVDVNNLAIDIPSSARSRARAERLKKFYQGVWASVKQPVLRTSVRQAFLYGISWLKVMFDPDRWPEAPVLDDYETKLPTRKHSPTLWTGVISPFPLSSQQSTHETSCGTTQKHESNGL